MLLRKIKVKFIDGDGFANLACLLELQLPTGLTKQYFEEYFHVIISRVKFSSIWILSLFEINYTCIHSFIFSEIKYVEEENWKNYLFNRFIYHVLITAVIRKSGTQYFTKDVHCFCHTISAWTNLFSQYVLLISAVFESIYIDCLVVVFDSIHYSKVSSKEFKCVSFQKENAL